MSELSRRSGAASDDLAVALPGRISRRRCRQLAVALVAYGVFGLLVLGLGSIVAASSLATIAPLSASLETQRLELVQTLHATSAALGDAATSEGDLEASLDQARVSSDQAAGIARGVAVTMRGMADAAGLTIFGTQPLVGFANSFRQSGDQLDALGANLDGVTQALAQNRTDLEAGAAGLADLRSQIDILAASVASMGPFADPTTSATTLKLVFVALVLFLALPAMASLGAGILLWRRAATVHRPAEATGEPVRP